MTCSPERLQEYHDGRLSEVETAEIQSHLQQCEPCRTSLQEMQWLDSALRAGTPVVPGTLPKRTRPALSWLRVAAAVVLLVVGFHWYEGPPAPVPHVVAEARGATLLDCEVWVDGHRVPCQIIR